MQRNYNRGEGAPSYNPRGQQYPQIPQPQRVMQYRQPVIMQPVVQPQPVVAQQVQQPRRNQKKDKEFHSNLCNCCSAGTVNCLGAFLGCVPCLLAGARNDFDSSNACFNCCCVNPCVARSLIREGYGIDGSCGEDILIASCCGPCSAVQLVSEVRKRGPVRQQM